MPAKISLKFLLLCSSTTALGLGASIFGYQLLRADLAKSIYRERLEAMADQYQSLQHHYNDAVRRTAVTELVVNDGRLSVRIRNAAGIIEDIPTPYDPRAEIYVDYAIVDGRLWIRRVFDALTPPSSGLVIDPERAHIDWNEPRALFGKAVYRSLDEGRWVVSVSGDGSLGLRMATDDPTPLAAPPLLGTFEEIETDIQSQIADIRPGDIWRQLWSD